MPLQQSQPLGTQGCPSESRRPLLVGRHRGPGWSFHLIRRLGRDNRQEQRYCFSVLGRQRLRRGCRRHWKQLRLVREHHRWLEHPPGLHHLHRRGLRSNHRHFQLPVGRAFSEKHRLGHLCQRGARIGLRLPQSMRQI